MFQVVIQSVGRRVRHQGKQLNTIDPASCALQPEKATCNALKAPALHRTLPALALKSSCTVIHNEEHSGHDRSFLKTSRFQSK